GAGAPQLVLTGATRSGLRPRERERLVFRSVHDRAARVVHAVRVTGDRRPRRHRRVPPALTAVASHNPGQPFRVVLYRLISRAARALAAAVTTAPAFACSSRRLSSASTASARSPITTGSRRGSSAASAGSSLATLIRPASDPSTGNADCGTATAACSSSSAGNHSPETR